MHLRVFYRTYAMTQYTNDKSLKADAKLGNGIQTHNRKISVHKIQKIFVVFK